MRLLTALVAVVAVVFGSVAPAAANAAENRTVVGSGEGAVLLEPTKAQRAEAMKRLEQARLADPAGFANRLDLIQESKELREYLSSDSRFDSGLQQQFLAASMPTDILESLVSLTDSGYLTLELADGPNKTKVAKLIKAERSMIGGGKGSMGKKPMFPQCPSAWAALWAWWGTNAAFCGAMGFFGPMAALGCSAAMAIAGSVIDFNRGCR
ncbi:hypothetical protein [Arthrobacter sp. B2a2-09]|uniref:hypothetical protein n=1 Tax=Arthrobacter sp. B2a2-09 TaxID=2952822 RepID=UPI0022CD6BBF|nr:hypothetical protein [Arthrobacter sp. B2a2-09]MCZ9884520.1 hypothetical protein [Arthrobacter sp. B2a2-09]